MEPRAETSSSPAPERTEAPVLDVQNLRTHFYLDDGILKAVDGVSYSVGSQSVLGVIGESGCGKSVTAQSILRIVPDPGRIVTGKILFTPPGADTIDLATLPKSGPQIRSIRGRGISMIFQEPMTSLSPVHTIGNQIEEMIMLHRTDDPAEAREIAVDMLSRVGIPKPAERVDYYPHQLSGGLRQRTMIAMALSCQPSLLIADEPTTALDVTVQAQILELMKELQDQIGMAILYITHDLGVIAEISYEVVVMYLGRVVERAKTIPLFKNPLHPYTQKLLRSIPKLGRRSRTKLDAIRGTVPIPMDPPPMCGFFDRCDQAMPGVCDKKIPALVEVEKGHAVRCFLRSDEEEAPV